jgi:hypothetical protein
MAGQFRIGYDSTGQSEQSRIGRDRTGQGNGAR